MSVARAIRAMPAALAGGTGLWLALGTVALDNANGGRLGVLAPWWTLAALVLVPLVIAAWSDAGSRRSRAWYLGALGWLPWLPVQGAAALLVWQGPLAKVLLIACVALALRPSGASHRVARIATMRPERQAAVACVVAAVCYLAAASWMAPILPGGDEPHYLIITQSLLNDGDLAIENNHQRRDYLAYFDLPIKPDYLRRGSDGAIYSIHAPGLSALVAPAFALAGYPGVVVLLAVIAALGTGLVWLASWRVTASAGAAWAGWAAVSLSVPFFFQAFTVFPDGPGAVLVMVAVYGLVLFGGRDVSPADLAALKCRPPLAQEIAKLLLYGAAIALLPWLHTRFSILAAVLGALLTWRVWQGSRSLSRVLAFAMLPLLSAVLWLAFFYVLYGTPNPAAPYGGYTQSSLGNAWRGITGLLIDQQFGLLSNAPIYLAAFAGLLILPRTRPRLAIELAAVVLPYVVAAASYHMWWGGRSTPARFAVPVLLPAGLAVATAWKRGGGVLRAGLAVLLAGSLGLTAILAIVDRGALAYNTRDGFSLWLTWIAPQVRLPLALPSLFRFDGALAAAWSQALAWALAAALAWAAVRWITRIAIARRLPLPFIATALAVLGLTFGTSLGWMFAAGEQVDRGSGLWRVARAAARPGAVAVHLSRFRIGDAAMMIAGVPLPAPAPRPDAQGASFTALDVPPGEYAVRVSPDVGERTVAARVGRRLPPIATMTPAAGARGDSVMRLVLPFGAGSLRIDSASGDALPLDAVTVAPLRLTRATVPLARAAVGYDRGVLWLLNDNAWAEPGGLWTRGTNAAAMAVDGRGAVPLRLRNGPVQNAVTIAAGSWRARIALDPGVIWDVDVPVAAVRTPITIAAGRAFRPLDHDARSGDARLLGVWVEVR